MKQLYLKHPSSKEEWLGISSGFEDSWNFPHCLGAIDGKHIRIECPKLTGSYYYNYKGFYSISLLAICDSNYCFTLFDLGHYGRNNDSGVLAKSEMGELIETQKIGIPQPAKNSTCDFDPLPYFFVGDEISFKNPANEALSRHTRHGAENFQLSTVSSSENYRKCLGHSLHTLENILHAYTR